MRKPKKKHVTRLSLITGGSGFIGAALVEELVRREERVRIFDIAAPAEPLPENVEYVQGSILDRGALKAALSGANRLYHLAAVPDLWAPDKRKFHEVNTEGTRMVLEAARNADLERIVFTSTESIIRGLDRNDDGAPVNEESVSTLENMPGPYCRSKYLAERAAIAAAREGLPLIIVNPTLPIGPGDRRITPPTRMLLGYLNGEYTAYLDTEFNLVYVRDVARGHALAAERGRIGERYVLGGHNVRLGELLRLMEEITGLKMARLRVPYPLAYIAGLFDEFIADHLTHKPPRAPLTGIRLAARSMVFDTTKAQEELGYSITPLRTALVEAIRWLYSRDLPRRPLAKELHLSPQ